MTTTLLETLAREIGRLLEPLAYAAENPAGLDRLLAELGAAPLEADLGALVAAFDAVAALKAQIEELASQPSPSLTGIRALLEVTRSAFVAIRGLSDIGGSAGAFAGLGEDLANFLVA